MKKKDDTPDGTALSHGERVARAGVLASRRGSGEGSFSPARPKPQAWLLLILNRTAPSPVLLRLVKAPEADTLSPRERAESTSAPPLTI